MLAASFSSLAPAALIIGAVGACAGTSYVTGFTCCRRTSTDELRGRTFATLYTVVRLCLLISLTISPLWADFWDWVTNQLFTDQTVVDRARYSLRRSRVCASRSGAAASSPYARGHRRGCAARVTARRRVGRRRSASSRQSAPETDGSGERRSMPGDRAVRGARRRRRQREEHAGGAPRPPACAQRGVAVCETFEPGATGAGAVMRELLLHGRRGRSHPTPRRCSWRPTARSTSPSEIAPALARGEWVVCDRYVPSSLVYQGVVRGLGVDAVEPLNRGRDRQGSSPTSSSSSTSPTRSRDARAGDRARTDSKPRATRSTPRCARRTATLADERGWVVVDGDGDVDEVAAARRGRTSNRCWQDRPDRMTR